MIRIIGLSATLPNFIDIATFLRVPLKSGLFYFDASFRPVPLEQHFLGIRGKPNSQQARKNLDYATCEKVKSLVGEGHQVMVFVHARRETVKTAVSCPYKDPSGWVELVIASSKGCVTQYETTGYLMSINAGMTLSIDFSKERSASPGTVKCANCLRTALVSIMLECYGQIVISWSACLKHALSRCASSLAFFDKLIDAGKGLVLYGYSGLGCQLACTCRCVFLPSEVTCSYLTHCQTVLIKGTQIYDAGQGKFVDISVLDVLQIFGRAGRPGYESSGEGYILTPIDTLDHYLDAVTAQQPIESKFIEGMADSLNAEIALGTVTTVGEGVQWIGYTYLFVRLQKNPRYHGRYSLLILYADSNRPAQVSRTRSSWMTRN